MWFRTDYFVKVSPCEGGILVVGKDRYGKKYKLESAPAVRSYYTLPSRTEYGVAVGSDPEKKHPAIFFPYTLNRQRWQPKFVDGVLEQQAFDDEFYSKFDFVLMDEAFQIISLDAEVGRLFKEIAVWGAYELAELMKNHFWGEMYRGRTPALEKFLEAYRG